MSLIVRKNRLTALAPCLFVGALVLGHSRTALAELHSLNLNLVVDRGEEPGYVCVLTTLRNSDGHSTWESVSAELDVIEAAELEFENDDELAAVKLLRTLPAEPCWDGALGCRATLPDNDSVIQCSKNLRPSPSGSAARVLLLELKAKGKDTLVPQLRIDGATVSLDTTAPVSEVFVAGGHYRKGGYWHSSTQAPLEIESQCGWVRIDRPAVVSRAAKVAKLRLFYDKPRKPGKVRDQTDEKSSLFRDQCIQGAVEEQFFSILVNKDAAAKKSVNIELEFQGMLETTSGLKFSASWSGSLPDEVHLTPKIVTFSWVPDACLWASDSSKCPRVSLPDSGIENCEGKDNPDTGECYYSCEVPTGQQFDGLEGSGVAVVFNDSFRTEQAGDRALVLDGDSVAGTNDTRVSYRTWNTLLRKLGQRLNAQPRNEDRYVFIRITEREDDGKKQRRRKNARNKGQKIARLLQRQKDSAKSQWRAHDIERLPLELDGLWWPADGIGWNDAELFEKVVYVADHFDHGDKDIVLGHIEVMQKKKMKTSKGRLVLHAPSSTHPVELLAVLPDGNRVRLRGGAVQLARRLHRGKPIRIDGRPIDPVYAVDISYDGTTIHVRSDSLDAYGAVRTPGISCTSQVRYRYEGDRIYYDDLATITEGKLEIESPNGRLGRSLYFVGGLAVGSLFPYAPATHEPRRSYEYPDDETPIASYAIEADGGLGFWPRVLEGWRIEARVGAVLSVTPVRLLGAANLPSTTADPSTEVRLIPYVRWHLGATVLSPWMSWRNCERCWVVATGVGIGIGIGHPLLRRDFSLIDRRVGADFFLRPFFELRVGVPRNPRIELFVRHAHVFLEDNVGFALDLAGASEQKLNPQASYRYSVTLGVVFSF